MKNVNELVTNYQKSRRKFLNLLLSSSGFAALVSIFYPILKFLIPPIQSEAKPSSVLAGKLEDLKPNSGKIFRFGNQLAIVINTPDGELKAFTAICTHLDCTVQYRGDFEHIWCACHNGHYDLNGLNIQGPPPRPLTQFIVNVKGDQVFVSKESLKNIFLMKQLFK